MNKVDNLIKALKKYGVHSAACRFWVEPKKKDCDCGLREAQAGEPNEG